MNIQTLSEWEISEPFYKMICFNGYSRLQRHIKTSFRRNCLIVSQVCYFNLVSNFAKQNFFSVAKIDIFSKDANMFPLNIQRIYGIQDKNTNSHFNITNNTIMTPRSWYNFEMGFPRSIIMVSTWTTYLRNYISNITESWYHHTLHYITVKVSPKFN